MAFLWHFCKNYQQKNRWSSWTRNIGFPILQFGNDVFRHISFFTRRLQNFESMGFRTNEIDKMVFNLFLSRQVHVVAVGFGRHIYSEEGARLGDTTERGGGRGGRGPSRGVQEIHEYEIAHHPSEPRVSKRGSRLTRYYRPALFCSLVRAHTHTSAHARAKLVGDDAGPGCGGSREFRETKIHG